MDFSDALRILKAGGRARRRAWPAYSGLLAGGWVVLKQMPGFTALLMEYPDQPRHLFACSQRDILSDDWEAVPDMEG